MTAYLRRHGVGLEEIGLFAASLYAPWGFKWAWAPLIDLVRFERFGTSRAWIVFAQSMMIVTIGVVLFFDPAGQLGLVTVLIIVHNVFAATQDIAIDALAVRVLPENELGTANGLMFSAAYLGQAIGGSGALFIAGRFGYDAAFVFMLASLTAAAVRGLAAAARAAECRGACGAPAPQRSPVGAGARRPPRSTREALARIVFFLRDLYTGFFRSGSGPLIGVVFAILPQGAVALGLALATTIPIDLGMSEEQIAGLSLLTSVACRARLRRRRLGVRPRRPPQVARGLVRADRGADAVSRLASRWRRHGRRRRLTPGLYTGGRGRLRGRERAPVRHRQRGVHEPLEQDRGRHPVHRLHGAQEPRRSPTPASGRARSRASMATHGAAPRRADRHRPILLPFVGPGRRREEALPAAPPPGPS